MKHIFLFKGKFYDQIDGVVMGSPLAPVLANVFMGHSEKEWLSNYDGVSSMCWWYFFGIQFAQRGKTVFPLS